MLFDFSAFKTIQPQLLAAKLHEVQVHTVFLHPSYLHSTPQTSATTQEVVGCINDNNEEYKRLRFVQWCSNKCLKLNISKTVELVEDQKDPGPTHHSGRGSRNCELINNKMDWSNKTENKTAYSRKDREALFL